MQGFNTLVVFGFHLIGEAVFWLKSLCQLGFFVFLISIFGLGMFILNTFIML
ncbi:hypothetical protein [uncultured Gammaproteobacteria bacterium]|nr:hypothetical protein [uncultured Gammaproteobacteria bacterium]